MYYIYILYIKCIYISHSILYTYHVNCINNTRHFLVYIVFVFTEERVFQRTKMYVSEKENK